MIRPNACTAEHAKAFDHSTLETGEPNNIYREPTSVTRKVEWSYSSKGSGY